MKTLFVCFYRLILTPDLLELDDLEDHFALAMKYIQSFLRGGLAIYLSRVSHHVFKHNGSGCGNGSRLSSE